LEKETTTKKENLGKKDLGNRPVKKLIYRTKGEGEIQGFAFPHSRRIRGVHREKRAKEDEGLPAPLNNFNWP